MDGIQASRTKGNCNERYLRVLTVMRAIWLPVWEAGSPGGDAPQGENRKAHTGSNSCFIGSASIPLTHNPPTNLI